MTVSTALNLARSDDREDQRRSLVELQSLKDHRLTDTELARIVESIDALPPDHRVELLVILARQGTAETLESFAALIRAETERDDIFFPRWRAIGALRDLAAHHGLVLDVLLDGIIGSQSHDDAALLNRWITQGLLDDAGLRTVVARLSIEVTGASEIARQRLADAARHELLEDDDYRRLLGDIGLWLDLLGTFDPEGAEPVLVAASTHPDPYIASWGIVPLLRAGRDVAVADVERAGSSPESRAIILNEIRLDRLPAALRSQPAIAEAELVGWLASPMEVGRPPSDIEPLKVISFSDSDGQRTDLHVFRFRYAPPDSLSERSWMIGVAGMYRWADRPTVGHSGHTFSTLTPEDSMPIDEHIESIVGVLERWGNPRPGQTAP